MKLLFLLSIIVLMLAQSAALAGAKKSIPAPKIAKADMLVGAYYFPGWNAAEKWGCMAANDKVQHPLLGYYDQSDPDAADWHIKWALEHGVSFFAFDFYTAGGSQMLETALDDGFLKARYIDRFKFCLNWCNHAPESTMTEKELDDFGDLVIRKYLTHPSYLRIDGKPVVIFLVGHAFIRNLGVEKAKACFDRFQRKCRDAGLPGAYLVFCSDAMGANEVAGCKSAGVSAFGRYNYPYAGSGVNGPGKHVEMSYEHLIEQGKMDWEHWGKLTDGNYWPTVMPGWDRRPWCKDDDLIRTGSTPELFGKSLRQARDGVNKDRVVMIEAWNEWGEGSILEPSVEYGFAYLDQVRRVFCPNAGPHKDMDPKSAGMRMPVFDLKLPSGDTWTFDSDAMGWKDGGMSSPRNEWGAMAMVTLSTDPSLSSPPTFLKCKDYARVKIRMRASAAKEGTATGQFFWSTQEKTISEESSVTFTVLLDGKWHEYDLDLSKSKAWVGVTDRLRFDPVDAKDVTVELDGIRLSR